MSYPRFLAWDIAGSIIWGESFILAGRFFGDLAKKSAPFFAWLGHFAIFIFAAMVARLPRPPHLEAAQVPPAGPRDAPRALRIERDARRCGDRRHKPPFIVDLRHPLDYLPDPRVLPGALRIGPNELKQHSEIIPRDRDVILYCTCPSEETSAKVALQLHKLGIYRVRPLRGGFDGWKAGRLSSGRLRNRHPEPRR